MRHRPIENRIVREQVISRCCSATTSLIVVYAEHVTTQLLQLLRMELAPIGRRGQLSRETRGIPTDHQPQMPSDVAGRYRRRWCRILREMRRDWRVVQSRDIDRPGNKSAGLISQLAAYCD
jgi:hypothetical protein